MAGQVFKEEFRLRNFFYHFSDKTAFYRCQWKWPHWVYVSIRFLLAAYALFGFILELINYYDTAKIRDKSQNNSALRDNDDEDRDFDDWDTRRPWCVYFTMWTYVVLMAHLTLAALFSVLFYREENAHQLAYSKNKIARSAAEDSSVEFPSGDESEPLITAADIPHSLRPGPSSRSSSLSSARRRKHLPWFLKLSWFLSNVISSCALMVTTIFFMALYEGGPVDVYNTNTHILNTVFVVLDHLISARPVRLLHWPAPVIFGACYVLFSYMFWTFDHVNHVVYEGLMDWNKPGQAALNCFILALVVNPLSHSFYFIIYRLKLWLFDKIYSSPSFL